MPLRPSQPGRQLFSASVARNLQKTETKRVYHDLYQSRLPESVRGLLQARRPDLIVGELYEGASDGAYEAAE